MTIETIFYEDENKKLPEFIIAMEDDYVMLTISSINEETEKQEVGLICLKYNQINDLIDFLMEWKDVKSK